MSSVVQARRIDRPRRTIAGSLLRGLGVLAASATLTLSTAAGVSAAPVGSPVAGCSNAAPGEPSTLQWPSEPQMTIDTSAGYTAALETNCGTVTVELEAARAPRTVNSFVFLADHQYFDHSRCHRLTTEGIFVLQCGDPTASGKGGPGYKFIDENLAGATYPAGTVAMANAGPNTNGSQFFLVYQETRLPPNHTPFGRITEGLDVVTMIADAGVADGSGDGSPNGDVVLDMVTATRN